MTIKVGGGPVSSGYLLFLLCGSLGISLKVTERLFTNSKDLGPVWNRFGMIADEFCVMSRGSVDVELGGANSDC